MEIKSNFQKQMNILNNIHELKVASGKTKEYIAEQSSIIELKQGQTLLELNKRSDYIYIVLKGSLRLLSKDPISKGLFTVGTLGKDEIIGIVDVLRQGSCESAIAKQDSSVLRFPKEILLKAIQEDSILSNELMKTKSVCEGALIMAKRIEKMNPPPSNSKKWIKEELNKGKNGNETIKLLSSVVKGYERLVGEVINDEQKQLIEGISNLPIRYFEWNPAKESERIDSKMDRESRNTKEIIRSNQRKENPNSFGIIEAQTNTDLQGFKPIKGHGPVQANLAALRMIARAYGTPCPIDVLEKIIEANIERSGSIPIQGIGQLAEMLGLQTQLGDVKFQKLNELELPVLVKRETHYALITEVGKGRILLADPEKGWVNIPYVNAKKEMGENVKVLLLKRLSDTPKKEFGWGWFSPVIKRFKWPLVQVLLASLFIQLFQLANPLLLQQIIDKVINQSNLSALQVLGGALVTAALFQGLLTAVRQWLLIDTTDRMDLLLGSQVIDKLLRLPLRFFEKRPVGELSQRLSELGNLRGFLTGTAITSALDLLFAVIYIGIMLIYSPLLTGVALCTIPLYIIMVIFIAPVYRSLLRKQAQYSARTQSHLIETLGGIQTVKAQHFELTSRWKWQERYSGQIAEGFKSVVLGSSAGEIGNFLNQLSSLLIIWVGVYMVVNAELSLGQLIAFRIIAGYVTGPILRLSSLWQGFQQVGISMERLSDIVDQIPEAGENDSDQISLPPIEGKVKFDNITFRFEKKGNYQIEKINLEVQSGSFVGIVGQSGSGKSTLMKLLPRLYEPNEGRILVDDYDIGKVNLSSVRQQIGIVPQDCLLFEGTIRENITMNHPEANTKEVIDVAKAAAAHDFIMELSNGYATRLGERGAGLSGGQRQRIAIARTLLQNPNMLILDEATSALDYDTESTVCRNLQQRLNDKTVFFITHRLSTVRGADIIILMHDGRITEKGTHEELMALGGRYKTLYAHQGDI